MELDNAADPTFSADPTSERAAADDAELPRGLILVLLVCLVVFCWLGVSALDAAAAHGLFGPVSGGCGGG